MNSNEHWVRSCLGKKRYRTLGFAQTIADRIAKDPTRPSKLYVYCCPSCQGFHLTKRKEYGNRTETVRI